MSRVGASIGTEAGNVCSTELARLGHDIVNLDNAQQTNDNHISEEDLEEMVDEGGKYYFLNPEWEGCRYFAPGCRCFFTNHQTDMHLRLERYVTHLNRVYDNREFRAAGLGHHLGDDATVDSQEETVPDETPDVGGYASTVPPAGSANAIDRYSFDKDLPRTDDDEDQWMREKARELGNPTFWDGQGTAPWMEEAGETAGQEPNVASEESGSAGAPEDDDQPSDGESEDLGSAGAPQDDAELDEWDPRRIWCGCRTVSTEGMVGCERTDCPLAWFHEACVTFHGQEDLPWFCPLCWPQATRDEQKLAGPRPRWRGPALVYRLEEVRREEQETKARADAKARERGFKRRRPDEDDEDDDDDDDDSDDESYGGHPQKRQKLESAMPPKSQQKAVVEQADDGEEEDDDDDDDEETGDAMDRRAKAQRKNGGAWSITEECVTIGVMAILLQQKQVKGDARWDAISRRLKQDHQIDRSPGAVKNQWNRVLRERSGIDERHPSAQGRAMQTGLQTPKKNKAKREL